MRALSCLCCCAVVGVAVFSLHLYTSRIRQVRAIGTLRAYGATITFETPSDVTERTLATLLGNEWAVDVEGVYFLNGGGTTPGEGRPAVPRELICGDADLKVLSDVSTVRHLSLARTRVTRQGLAALAPLERLCYLDLRGLSISTQELVELGRHADLVAVHVSCSEDEAPFGSELIIEGTRIRVFVHSE
jgi:hypothetical protein